MILDIRGAQSSVVWYTKLEKAICFPALLELTCIILFVTPAIIFFFFWKNDFWNDSWATSALL